MKSLDPEGHADPGSPTTPERQLVGDRYRLEGDTPLGSGGMGEVWRATDTLLHRAVALKQVRTADLDRAEVEEMRQRALREGRIAARLHHPNVVTVFDVIISDDQLWLVLEYVPSRSADKLLAAEGPLPYDRVAHIGAQIAEALAAAHAAGIWHRDIKPGNILIDPHGQAKLTDFGISRAVNELQLTSAGLIPGTPAYLAPEIARGEDYTGAADIYSLGATLYALVEGAPPFGRGHPHNPLRLLRQIATGTVPPPSQAGPLTPALTQLIDQDPDRRPAATVARDLLAAASGPSVAPPPAAPAPTPTLLDLRPPRPHRAPRRLIVAIAVLLITAGALAAAYLLFARTPDPPSQVATDRTYIPEPRRANPCAFLNTPDFERFGHGETFGGSFYNTCYISIRKLNGGDSAIVSANFLEQEERYGPTEKRGDLTIFRPDRAADGSCRRFIALPSRTTIANIVYVWDSGLNPCELADMVTANALRALATPPLPMLGTIGDPNSLRRQIACQIFDSQFLSIAPHVDPTKSYTEFGEWDCVRGMNSPRSNPRAPYARVHFILEPPLSKERDGAQEKIAGRDVFINQRIGINDQVGCLAKVVHRHTKDGVGAPPFDEVVYVGVYAPIPYNQQCQMVRELAAKVIPNLPPP
ncbi:serine/threonine-protein kinase [Pseudonocardia acaciae]|uniref:serine/threonine-protein kinase n=1 Tax=Pseudonocardia acaciae TaxID=551276 RepID=UPI0014701A1F|nr:serine/threonine-protein kinase [Pseudonocardia acaciae]